MNEVVALLHGDLGHHHLIAGSFRVDGCVFQMLAYRLVVADSEVRRCDRPMDVGPCLFPEKRERVLERADRLPVGRIP